MAKGSGHVPVIKKKKKKEQKAGKNSPLICLASVNTCRSAEDVFIVVTTWSEKAYACPVFFHERGEVIQGLWIDHCSWTFFFDPDSLYITVFCSSCGYVFLPGKLFLEWWFIIDVKACNKAFIYMLCAHIYFMWLPPKFSPFAFNFLSMFTPAFVSLPLLSFPNTLLDIKDSIQSPELQQYLLGSCKSTEVLGGWLSHYVMYLGFFFLRGEASELF